MTRFLTIVLVTLVLGLGAVACGGDDNEASTTETTTTETSSTPVGREVFVANCGSCHTLSDAGTSGAVGPNLDTIGLDASAVENQVRNGGGGMPPFEGQLTDEEITEVAAYVAANDGS
jgi:mono/diheme cytochrome c family protein